MWFLQGAETKSVLCCLSTPKNLFGIFFSLRFVHSLFTFSFSLSFSSQKGLTSATNGIFGIFGIGKLIKGFWGQ